MLNARLTLTLIAAVALAASACEKTHTEADCPCAKAAKQAQANQGKDNAALSQANNVLGVQPATVAPCPTAAKGAAPAQGMADSGATKSVITTHSGIVMDFDDGGA